VGLRPHSDNDCIQEVARVEEEDGGGGWVALWRPSRTPPKRGRLSQSAEWGGAGVDLLPYPPIVVPLPPGAPEKLKASVPHLLHSSARAREGSVNLIGEIGTHEALQSSGVRSPGVKI